MVYNLNDLDLKIDSEHETMDDIDTEEQSNIINESTENMIEVNIDII